MPDQRTEEAIAKANEHKADCATSIADADRHAIEAVHKSAPEFDGVTPLALVVKSVDAVD